MSDSEKSIPAAPIAFGKGKGKKSQEISIEDAEIVSID